MTSTEASSFPRDNVAIHNPYPARDRDHHTVPFHLYPYPSHVRAPVLDLDPSHASPSSDPSPSSYSATAPNLSSQTVHEGYTASPLPSVGSDGDASVLDVGGELVGKVDTLAAAVLVVVVLELPLEFLGPGHDSINALRPFGGDLCTGFGATQLGLRLDNGGVNGPVATFIDRGAIGGLSQVGDGATMETEGEIACDEGTTGEARLLPCLAGVPHLVIEGGGATAGREGNCAIGCAWRGLGRGGNATGMVGSTLDITGGGAPGGTERGFEFESK
jgi:hypothetical protein